MIFFEDSLEGLGVGAPVKYRGVQIGQVVVDHAAPSRRSERSVDIPVVIELHRDVGPGRARTAASTLEQLIEEGLRARLELASLITGQLFVGLNIFPGTPLREAPERHGLSRRSLRSLRCSTGLQQTLTDLIADRPKLAKGLDQMLELLNFMAADGGAQNMAKGVRSMAQLADSWPTRRGRCSRPSTSCRP